jgi:hypothetical protein
VELQPVTLYHDVDAFEFPFVCATKLVHSIDLNPPLPFQKSTEEIFCNRIWYQHQRSTCIKNRWNILIKSVLESIFVISESYS